MNKRLLLGLGLIILSVNSVFGANRYWVGGTGNWSDNTNHWSSATGGVAGATLPAAGDSVFFDANSGLAATDIVTIDQNVNVLSIDFSGVGNTFIFNNSGSFSVTLTGSLVGNTSGVTFNGTWGEIIFDAVLTTESITSGGTTWIQNFRISGNQITLTDNLPTPTGTIFVDTGGVNLSGNLLTCNQFLSTTTATRNLNLSNGIVSVNSGVWTVIGTGLTLNSTNSSILLGDNTGVATFTGGSLDYDTLRSTSATTLSYLDNNTFSLVALPTSSTLEINNGDNLSTDSLMISGNCSASANITTPGPGANATFTKTGYNILNLTKVDVNKVNSTGGATCNLIAGTATSSTGWTPTGSVFYWIGNTGNWNDGAHWSYTSGGTANGCIPTSSDSVFFDANSFSIANQTVTVDDTAFFKSMDWTGISGLQTLALDSNIMSYGDITFDPNLSVIRNIVSSGIQFMGSAVVDPASAELVDCSFLLTTAVSSNTVSLADSLVMTDSSSVILFNGHFNTAGNYLSTGSINTINDPTQGSDLRTLSLGSSNVNLFFQFNAYGDTSLTLNAGTSLIYIGDTSGYNNALTTVGKAFYDVTLNFQPVSIAQTITGNNSFRRLTILPGSEVYIDSNSTQNITDSLIIKGNCLDSIFISTVDTATFTSAKLNKIGSATQVVSQCVNYQGINASGTAFTTYFSNNLGSNSNITFNTSSTSVPSFIPDSTMSSFCFGDTVYFTNNSTSFSGNTNDLTFHWYFNDGSTGYYLNPPTDSTYITYEADTNKHVFLQYDSINVILESIFTNYCVERDTFRIDIINPNISLLTSESDTTLCPWQTVTHEAFSAVPGTAFEFFVNGVSQNTPSVNDTLFVTNTLSDQDTVSVLAYEQGCVSDTMPSIVYTVFSAPVFNFTSNDADTSICLGDPVAFNAWSADSLYEFSFIVNSTPVTAYMDSVGSYTTSSLADNDYVYVVARDTNSCTDTLNMQFNVDPLPGTALSESTGGNVICNGQLVSFTASGADQFEFFINNTSVQGPSTTATFSTSSLTSTDTVRVMGINNNGCMKYASEEYVYIVLASPNTTMISSDADSVICSGTNVIFNASGASQYQFYINGTSVQGPSTTSSYQSSTLTDQDTIYVVGTFSGCSGTSSNVIMTVNTSPTTALTNDDDGDNKICYGTPVTFTASGATNYEFFVDGTSQGTSSATATFSTSTLTNGQTIQVVGESNNCTVSAQQTFTVLNVPNVQLFSNDTDNTICQSGSITFTGANASQYQFFVNGTSVQGPGTTNTLSNPSLNIGANDVLVIGTASNGCTDSSIILNVTVNPLPTITVSSSDMDNTICAGESVTFTGSGADMYQFILNGVPQGVLAAANTFTTSGLTSGQSVQIYGTLLGCPSTSNSITTTVNPIPGTALNSTDVDNIYCESDVVTYTATGATNYEFFVNGVSQGASSPVNTINSSGFTPGSYTLSVTGESNNCTSNAQMSITVNALPSPTVSSSDVDNTICQGETVVYTGSGASLYEFFVNGTSQGALSSNSIMSINSLNDGDVISVVGYSSAGCSQSVNYPAITVNPNPTVILNSSDVDQQICIGDNVDFTATGATDYEFFINGTSLGAPSPTNTFSTTTLSNNDVITVEGSSLGCLSSSNTLLFNVFGPPVVSLTNNGDNELCVGEAADLTAGGAANYQFLINGSPAGPYSATNTFNGTLNNGDVVTVNGESNGCINTSATSITYIVLNYPTLSSTSSDIDNIICLNDLISFTASGGTDYDFSLNGNSLQYGTGTNFDISTLADGDIITITAYNGDCPSSTDSYTFTVNSMNLDLVATPSNMICAGESATFTATGADEYEFFLNGVSTGAMSTTNTYTNSSLVDEDEITFTGYSNTTLCTQPFADYIIMDVIDQPVADAQSTTDFCDGDSVILISNAPYGNQWFLNGSPITGATDTMYVAYTSGTYSLETTTGGTGSLWSFGHNADGMFADGNNINNADPTASTSAVSFDEISAGAGFLIGVTTAGEVYAWGDNSSGQLGDGTYTSSNITIQVPTLSNIKTVATTEYSSMVTTNTGEVYVWGNNTQGQLGTGNTTVINFPFLNTSITNVDTIAGGRKHFVILKNDGTVWTVGNNDYGQLGQGTLVGSMTAIQVAGLSNVVSVGAGEYHSFAINNSGDLYVWGNNGSGQLGLNDLNNRLVPTLASLKNVVNAQGGANHSAFMTSDKKVFTSGGNTFGQLGTGNYVPVSTPVEVAVSGVEMISTGQYTTLVKRGDNTVFGFGNNTEDQLSSTTGTTVPTPEYINDLDGVGFIEAGWMSSHVLFTEAHSCVSSDVVVNVSSTPVPTITATGNTLSTISGSSYQWYFGGLPIPGATSQTYEANEGGDYYVVVTNASGCSGTSPIYTVSLAGVMNDDLQRLVLYPNPARNTIHLIVPENTADVFNVTIYDQAGRIVFEEEFVNESNLKIDVSPLESGIYNLVLHNSNAYFNSRFTTVRED